MKPLHVLAPAEQELSDAALFYEEQAAGLGADFLEQVRKVFSDISKYPVRYPVMALHIRRHLVYRFPYVVLYRNAPEEVVVVAVMHVRRQPHYWISRA